MECHSVPRCLHLSQTRPALPSVQRQTCRARVIRRVAFTPNDLASQHADSLTRTAVIDVSPQATGWDSEETLALQRLQEEYKRGYEAGLQEAQRQQGQPAQKELVHDSVARTAAKALTWRILSTGTTIGLALWLFKDSIETDAALELGVVEFLSKYGLYFVHERAWAAITFLL